MLQMKKLAPPGSADIFAKLEYLNPGGSVKDRAAIGLIERAEREGKLKHGGTVTFSFLAPIEPGLEPESALSLLEQRLEAETDRLVEAQMQEFAHS